MTTSRIILPDGNGRTVEGRAPAHVGLKLLGHEFRTLRGGDIKNYTITHIAYDERRDHYTFYTNYTPEEAAVTNIRLWKDNKLNQEHEISINDLVTKFWEYEDRHDLVGSWPLERCIRAFITDKESEGGLQSVFDEQDYEDIYEAVRDAWPEDKR